jgi:hypothetical protein
MKLKIKSINIRLDYMNLVLDIMRVVTVTGLAHLDSDANKTGYVKKSNNRKL